MQKIELFASTSSYSHHLCSLYIFVHLQSHMFHFYWYFFVLHISVKLLISHYLSVCLIVCIIIWDPTFLESTCSQFNLNEASDSSSHTIEMRWRNCDSDLCGVTGALLQTNTGVARKHWKIFDCNCCFSSCRHTRTLRCLYAKWVWPSLMAVQHRCWW